MSLAGPKYRSLSRLIEVLEPPLVVGRLGIDKRWRDNEESLGLYAPNEVGVTAFIYTYAQPTGCYGLELGYPDPRAVDAAGVTTTRELLDLAQVVELLRSHFDLSQLV